MSPRDVTRELVTAAKELLEAVAGAKEVLCFDENGGGPFVALVDRPQYQDGKGHAGAQSEPFYFAPTQDPSTPATAGMVAEADDDNKRAKDLAHPHQANGPKGND
jgi:hypothetical protein